MLLEASYSEAESARIREFENRVGSFSSAVMLWTNLLTTAQRDALGGDLEAAWKGGGTLGMWISVTEQTPWRGFVELGRKLDLFSDADAAWLRRALGEPQPLVDVERPRWDRETGELWFEDRRIREVAGNAPNVRRVFTEFEELGWPFRINNPLGKQIPTRFASTLRSLNNGVDPISFHGDGTGAGFRWQRRTV